MIKRCPQHGLFRGEHCHCGSAGQVLLDETKTEQLGRLVAGSLRHFPADLGLEMDSHGWVDLAKLGEVVASRHRWAGKDLIIASIDGTKDATQALLDGKVLVVIECNPKFGPAAFDAIEKYGNGETLETRLVNIDRVFTNSSAKVSQEG